MTQIGAATYNEDVIVHVGRHLYGSGGVVVVDSPAETDPFDKVPISEARAHLPELATRVATGSQEPVELRRRDAPAALLVSYARFAALLETFSRRQPLERRRRQQLAWLITEQWLDAAPPHLREPQIAELERLPEASLIALFSANPGRPDLESLVRAGVDRATFDRLKKRRKLARAIKSAEEDGLYEAAEDATSRIDLEQPPDNDK